MISVIKYTDSVKVEQKKMTTKDTTHFFKRLEKSTLNQALEARLCRNNLNKPIGYTIQDIHFLYFYSLFLLSIHFLYFH